MRSGTPEFTTNFCDERETLFQETVWQAERAGCPKGERRPRASAICSLGKLIACVLEERVSRDWFWLSKNPALDSIFVCANRTLFFKTQKDFPKDEAAINAQFLIRANFIQKLMAGAHISPARLAGNRKIQNVIREEMNALGASEISDAGASSAFGLGRRAGEECRKIMHQFKDRGGHEFGLGPTHEEIVTPLAKPIISSYADLPLSVYQIQMKFRDEPRAKSGLIRGRQFMMKDLYSFHENEASLEEYYDEARKAYLKVFSRLGLKTYVTEASGGDFTKNISHEFMVESEAGEDEILLCRLCGFARNKEIAELKAEESCPKCGAGVLEKVKGIEVGNIFKLGTKAFRSPSG